ncbi:zf-HC2 domain-containing protein [bacterium]|nr:zf-HC2 domain-containing protein [bacterium]
MLNCKEVTRLVSESFDRQLTLRERFGLRLHTMMCGTCHLFRQLQERIYEAIILCGRRDSSESTEPPLPDEARTRIDSAVQTAITNRSGTRKLDH